MQYHPIHLQTDLAYDHPTAPCDCRGQELPHLPEWNKINYSLIPNQQHFSLVSNFSFVTRIMNFIGLTWAVADVGKTKIWVTDASCGVFNGTELDDFSVEST